MRNTITRYEVELTNGHQSYLVAYTPRVSRPGLRVAVQRVGAAILRITNLSDTAIATWTRTRTPVLDLGENGWIVRFTGRTEIDAQDSTQLPYVNA